MNRLSRRTVILLGISVIALTVAGCIEPEETPPPATATSAPTATVTATPLPPTNTPAPTPTPDRSTYPDQPERTRLDPAEFPGLTLAEDSDLPWWNDRVFYEVFVRSFYDSDGDGIGDLPGLTEKLDYLNDGDPETTTDLGVTGIWLMPIMDSPSYHGYDVTDYYTVNPDYGTNEDFKDLIAAAHERGIVVIIDMVLNHTSSQHPWFEAARDGDPDYRDWYIWSDSNPAYTGPWGQAVWHRTPDGSFYYGIFASSMPDLNYNNPEVTAQMEDVSRFWLEEMGADGFRLDAIKHIVEDGRSQENTPGTIHWMYEYNDVIDSIDPNALTVGEVWSPANWVKRFIVDGVDVAFEFDYATAILNSVRNQRAAFVNDALRAVLDTYPAGQFATFLTNHDQNRVMDQLRNNPEDAKIAATILLTGPGIPFIYYGEEIGMQGIKPDERIRTPMQWTAEPSRAGFTTGEPWEALASDVERYNVTTENRQAASLLNRYRTLIGLRNQYAALRLGETRLVESDTDSIYAILRYVEGQAVLVVLNLSDEPVADFSLTLAEGPLSPYQRFTTLFGERTPSAFAVTESGGFVKYSPVARLEGREVLIILFD